MSWLLTIPIEWSIVIILVRNLGSEISSLLDTSAETWELEVIARFSLSDRLSNSFLCYQIWSFSYKREKWTYNEFNPALFILFLRKRFQTWQILSDKYSAPYSIKSLVMISEESEESFGFNNVFKQLIISSTSPYVCFKDVNLLPDSNQLKNIFTNWQVSLLNVLKICFKFI